MTAQFVFTVLIMLGGLGGMALGAWTLWKGRITVRRGNTTETLAGTDARRFGAMLLVGAFIVMLFALIVLRPMF
jgi:hypothetical protein